MLQLHYFPGNASLIPHIVLEELGLKFELLYVDRAVAAHKSDAYLALNPNGLIPVLVDRADTGGATPLVLYETAAICLHLADTHPTAALLPPLGTAERAHAYKWLAWLTNTLQATLIVYFYPERWADDAAAILQVKAHAETKIDAMLDQLGSEFARHAGPWLLGERFSVLDPYAFVLCRWTRGFARPARERAALKPWLDRMLARPAVQRAVAAEKLQGTVV
ncbi:MAG: glutathione S-transferase N-terminal domain-containing protein [Pseudomonadota bacterium]|nr:glutathione S-transferase N-terminal domain-containing protein [Pseudomonadota bacterium]